MSAIHAARPAGRSRTAARLRGERGAAAVEFALVLPLLLLLLFGIVAVSQAFQTQARLSAAAREGARVMALGGDTSQVTDAVRKAVGDLDIPDSDIRPSPDPCTTTAPLATVTVEVFYDQSFGAGLFGDLGIDLTGKAVMRCGG